MQIIKYMNQEGLLWNKEGVLQALVVSNKCTCILIDLIFFPKLNKAKI